MHRLIKVELNSSNVDVFGQWPNLMQSVEPQVVESHLVKSHAAELQGEAIEEGHLDTTWPGVVVDMVQEEGIDQPLENRWSYKFVRPWNVW